MNAGRSLARALAAAALLCLLQVPGPAAAIDNPEAPDLVGAFEARERPYEERIEQQARTDAEIAQAFTEYERFLDAELNRAYAALLGHLGGEARNALVASQRRWLQYRDAEFAFIDANWTRERFGSSRVVTRGASRTLLVRHRTLEVLDYLKNYPPGPAH